MPQQPPSFPQTSDFVLFPAADSARPSREPASVERAPATPSSARSGHVHPALHGPHRRNSSHTTTHSVFSPYHGNNNPRVNEILHGQTVSSSSSSSPAHRFSLSAQNSPFSASSAPSSSAALQRQRSHPQHRTARPQVPAFPRDSADELRAPLAHVEYHPSPSTAMSNGMSAASASTKKKADLAALDMALLGLGAAELGDELLPEPPFFDDSFAAPHFTSVNDTSTSLESSTNTGTVSPQDIMRDPLASMPPSSTLTNLTSPSLFDSPDIESFDTSPVFQNADPEYGGGDRWFSLFPGTAGESDESPQMDLQDATAYALASDHAPRRPSATQSPATHAAKHSSVSGVSARKRDKPLPPINIDDPADTVKMKRARNTLAARKSRQRKVERFDELEKTIEDLKNERDHWKSMALNRPN